MAYNRVGTILSEHNVYEHKLIWAQMCLGTNVFGHKPVWAQKFLGTNVSGLKMCGHKRVWAQTCVGTVVWAQSCMGTNVEEPEKYIGKQPDGSAPPFGSRSIRYRSTSRALKAIPQYAGLG